jgi:hypothetical protein
MTRAIPDLRMTRAGRAKRCGRRESENSSYRDRDALLTRARGARQCRALRAQLPTSQIKSAINPTSSH